MIPCELRDGPTDKALGTVDCPCDPTGSTKVLKTMSPLQAHGTFKSATRTTAGTTVITSPDGDTSIVLSDLIITTDKVNGATCVVQFNDGVNQVIIARAILTNGPCNLASNFTGHWHGWKDAWLEMVTVGVVDATVSCGYTKITSEESYPFDEWDARR